MFHLETARLEPATHLGRLKSQPQIGEFAKTFILVSCQVNDGQFATIPQGPPGLCHGHGGS
jgi:hypothetical protein